MSETYGAEWGTFRHVAPALGPLFAAGAQVVAFSCPCGWSSDWFGIGVELDAVGELRAHLVDAHEFDKAKLRHGDIFPGSH